MTSKIVIGSASHPPREAGSDSRNKPACLALFARSAGMVRFVSASAAGARNSGTRASARANISSRPSFLPMAFTDPPFCAVACNDELDAGVDLGRTVLAASGTRSLVAQKHETDQ